MLLRSLEIKNFRSLEHVELDSLGTFNVLIGRNNSGKSALIGALSLLNSTIRGATVPDSVLTAHDKRRSLEMRLRFDVEESDRQRFFEVAVPVGRRESLVRTALLRQIEFVFQTVPGHLLLHLRSTSLITEDGEWVKIQRLVDGETSTNPQSKVVRLKEVFAQEASVFNSSLLSVDSTSIYAQINIHHNLLGSSPPFPEPGGNWFLQALEGYLGKAFFFNPFRHSTIQLPAQQTEQLAQDGSNLAQVLHTINSNNRQLFNAIEQFVHDALPDIGPLQTPLVGSATEISFRAVDDNYLVSLHDMGGGIEQLLMVATVLLTTERDCSVFLEEPESHLHAGAQRFLSEQLCKDGRQVFLTTHSPTFINSPRTKSMYRVSFDESRTKVSYLADDADLNDVLDEMGTLKSDLLLSDAVLFVEGPSDRRAFEAWSRTLGKNLDEHNVTVLTMDGGETADRKARVRSDVLIGISHRSPIPHLFVIDGDERSQAEVNALRNALGDRLHILASREIENYLLVPRALVSAIRSKYHNHAPVLERMNGDSDRRISELIRTTADSLHGLVLLKRIRSEIAGLAGGIITRDMATALSVEADSEGLGKRIREEAQSRLEHRLDELVLDDLVRTQRQVLDVEWADAEKRLAIAPGEEILQAVFQHFGGEYKKPVDAGLVAKHMNEDEIAAELNQLINKVVQLTKRIRSNCISETTCF